MINSGWFIGFSNKVSVKKRSNTWHFDYTSASGKIFSNYISIHPKNIPPQNAIKKMQTYTFPWRLNQTTSSTEIYRLFDPVWLTWRYAHKGKPIFSLHPYGFNDFLFQAPVSDTTFTLSRSATIRTINGALMLESPCSACAVVAHSPMVSEWLNDVTFSDGIKVTRPLNKSSAKQHFFWALASNGLLEEKSILGSDKAWDFYNLSFHSRTRNFNFQNVSAPESKKFKREKLIQPKLKLGRPITLPKPKGATKLNLVSKRQSWRGHDSKSINLKNIAELLVPFSQKAYPSAGAKYENHFYIAIRDCQDITRGLYYFDRDQFCLRKVAKSDEGAKQLIAHASQSWGTYYGLPQALVVVTTRLHQLQSKYHSLSYRLSLLNAGVILGRLDLQCQAIGLAGCILGTGDSRLFETTCGINHQVETSIAEFAFGRRKI